MWYDNICSSCEELERIRQPENKSDCEERYESCLIDKEAWANILCEPCD